eukprot:188667_1
MATVYILLLLITSSTSQPICCNVFDLRYNSISGECVVDCDDNGQTPDVLFSNSSLITFDDVMHVCDKVKYVNDINPSQCNNLTDLIWPKNCGCPSCKCIIENTNGYSLMHESQKNTFVSQKQCRLCTCEYNDDNQLIYECISDSSEIDAIVEERPNTFVENEFFANFSCPYTCTDYSGQFTTTAPGSTYFNNSNTLCNEFCQCQLDGNSKCIKGFNNILNS